MRCNDFKQLVSVWACTSAIALLSSSAAFAELPQHPDGTAFVGMPDAFDHGRVGIFTQTASGWQRSGTLDVPANRFEGDFGQSLAFRDGYVMVGASQSVYVFKRGNGRWTLSQRLVPPAGEIDFAKSLHFESGVLVVGAPNTFSDQRHGTAYVYERNAAGSFVLRSTLLPADCHVGDSFGHNVSVASGVIVIRAPNSRAPGAAHVFRRNSSGTWVERQRLVSSDTQDGDAFGWSVAIDKNMITVGAPNVDIEGVHSYSRNGSTVMPLGLATGFLESNSIALANQWLLVGSPLNFQCHNTGICIGEANVFNLNLTQ